MEDYRNDSVLQCIPVPQLSANHTHTCKQCNYLENHVYKVTYYVSNGVLNSALTLLLTKQIQKKINKTCLLDTLTTQLILTHNLA